MDMRVYDPGGGGGDELDLFAKFKDLLQPSLDHLETKIDHVFHKEANRVLVWLVLGLLGTVGTVAVTVWSAGQKFGHLQDAVEKELPKQIDMLRSSNEELKKSVEDLRRAVNVLQEFRPSGRRSGLEGHISASPRTKISLASR